MSIDKQRVAAVRTLEGLGYRWVNGAWQDPPRATVHTLALLTDKMGEVLEEGIMLLAGCTEDSAEEALLAKWADVLELYRAVKTKWDGAKT